MNTTTAPHPVLQSASFVIAFTGEGAAAYVVHGGWEAMLLRFAQEAIDYTLTALPGPEHVNAEEWALWLENFDDLDEWGGDESSEPYCFTSVVGEITRVAIYRLQPAADGVRACGEAQQKGTTK